MGWRSGISAEWTQGMTSWSETLFEPKLMFYWCFIGQERLKPWNLSLKTLRMVVANNTVTVSSVGSGVERSRDVVVNFCSSIIKIFLSPESRVTLGGQRCDPAMWRTRTSSRFRIQLVSFLNRMVTSLTWSIYIGKCSKMDVFVLQHCVLECILEITT